METLSYYSPVRAASTCGEIKRLSGPPCLVTIAMILHADADWGRGLVNCQLECLQVAVAHIHS